MNILFIRISSLGDVILTTPVLGALRARFPDATVTLATQDQYADLFVDDDRVHGMVTAPRRDGATFAHVLAAQPWDLVVDVQNSKLSRQIIKRLRYSELRTFDKQHGKRALLLFARRHPYSVDDHVVCRYLAAALGEAVPLDKAPSVEVRVNSRRHVRTHDLLASWDAGRPLLALVPFGAWRNKQWPSQRYEQVARHFIDKGWRVAVVGGPDNRDASRAMQDALGEHSRSVAGELGLGEITTLLSSARLALGNDTGLTHLARARGVRCGVVYGPTVRDFGFFPYGAPPYRVFETKVLCRPCHPQGGDRCLVPGRPCMSRVTARQVIEGLEALDQSA